MRVWQVLSAAQPAADGEARGTGSPAVSRLGAGAAQAPALLLSPTPHRVYTGHKQDVLDLTWSKTQVGGWGGGLTPGEASGRDI